jgi:adenylate cyclase
MPAHCRAGLHCGPVVIGEMGSLKKEIVFLGDTVNTTARIQNSAGKLVIACLLRRHW